MTDDGEQIGGGRPARRWVRWLAVGAAVAMGLLLVATAAWVLRLPDTEEGPLAAVLADPDLAVTIEDGGAVIEPVDARVVGTVVFYPGAGVAPSAYLPTWAPVVEETGLRVVVPSVPLRLAVFDSDVAAEVRAASADGSGGTWLVGGHSLGGAMAASFLAGTAPDEWDGLVLWAAYPPGDDLASRDDLVVVSVSGSRDGLTTPADVDASRADLPQGTDFSALEGVNHAQFGAYGDQRRDGTATVGDPEARQMIARATIQWLAGLD